MNKEELHNIVEEQPNICQIVAIKNNEIVYNDKGAYQNWYRYAQTWLWCKWGKDGGQGISNEALTDRRNL